MPDYGVILPITELDAAAGKDIDYVEPTIVGNLVVQGPDGRWVENPEYRGAERSPSFAILFPGDVPIADPSTPIEQAIGYLQDVLEVIGAHAEDAAKIVLGSGAARTIPDGADRVAAERRFADVLIAARDIARRNGVRIVLEPLHSGETNLLNSIGEAVAFLDRFGIDGVEVVADLFHIVHEQEPLSEVERLAPRIGHAHIADTDRRPPGQGDWPMREFVQALRRGGYAGDITIEAYWQDVDAELADAIATLKSIDA